MALTAEQQKVLEDLSSLITDEKARAEFKHLYETFEPVRAAVLRQSDYDSKMNTAKAERAREKQLVDKNNADMAKMQTWWQTTTSELGWDDKAKKFKVLETLRSENSNLKSEKEKLEERIRAAASGAGNGNGAGVVDQEQITQIVQEALKGRKFVTQEEINDLVKQAAGVLVDEKAKAVQDAFYQNAVPKLVTLLDGLSEIRWQHYQEFGTFLDKAAFDKYWDEHKEEVSGKTPVEIYNDFVAKERETAKEKKMREDIEKDVRTKHSVPGTGTHVEGPPVGPVETFFRGAAPAAASSAGGNGSGGDKGSGTPFTQPLAADRASIREGTNKAIAELVAEGK